MSLPPAIPILITSRGLEACCSVVSPVTGVFVLSVYVADDEVCLGQLQTVRLGEERAAAFDEERALGQHVR